MSRYVGQVEVKPRMTVIGALAESPQSGLIGCDSAAMEQVPGMEPVMFALEGKLFKHESAPVVWGIAGSTAIEATDLCDWLQRYPVPVSGLASFRFEVAGKLADANRIHREMMTRAGRDAKPGELTSMIMVGCIIIPDRIDVVEFDEDGQVTVYTNVGLASLGTGKYAAHIAFSALGRVPLETPLQHFTMAMETAAEATRTCSPPVHVWRVTPVGVSVLS